MVGVYSSADLNEASDRSDVVLLIDDCVDGIAEGPGRTGFSMLPISGFCICSGSDMLNCSDYY